MSSRRFGVAAADTSASASAASAPIPAAAAAGAAAGAAADAAADADLAVACDEPFDRAECGASAGSATARRLQHAFRRWLRFNVVGLGGFAVQMATLALLTRLTPLPLWLSVALAVLAAVLHNFCWHESYTWPQAARGRGARGLAFVLSNGVVSLLSNVLLTSALVAGAALPVLMSNGLAVGVTSLINFLIADRAIFNGARHGRRPCDPALALRAPCPVNGLSQRSSRD